MTPKSTGGMDKRLFLPLFLFVITSIYLASALQITPQFDEGLVGPSFVPILASILMYVSLVFVFRDIFRSERPSSDTAERTSLMAPVKVVVATGIYIALFKPLGYPVATFLYVYALLFVFGLQGAGQIRRIVYSALITAVFFGLFDLIFQVRLPMFDPSLGGLIG